MNVFDQIEIYYQERLPHVLEILRHMVGINSYTTNADGVNALGMYTADIFRELSFQAEFEQSIKSNYGRHLFLTRPANEPHYAPAIALVSHLDTVFSPEEEIQNNFYWRQEGNRIYGPGTVDIKGGTVMIYLVLDGLRKFFPELFESITWKIFINASEEVLSDDFSDAGLKRLPKNTLACLIFEAGNITKQNVFQIVTARKGRAAFKVCVEGKSAHAGNNHASGANAIIQMAEVVQKIADFTDYRQKITFNVGVIRGGSVMNRVPHYAEADIEMRSFSPDVFQAGIAKMVGLSGSGSIVSQEGFPCKIQVEQIEKTSPWPVNPDSEGLLTLWVKAGHEMGIEVESEARGGLSDGNFLWNHFPTLDGLGPSGKNAHCSESDPTTGKEQEYCTVNSFVPKALLNSRAIIQLMNKGIA